MLYFLPLFLMHYSVFVLIPAEGDVESLVDASLELFDESLEVEPYRQHLSHHEVRGMAAHYKMKPANLHALAAKMPDWAHCDGGVDRDGLYYVTTRNPDGYFDWFEIGGRWDGLIPGAQRNVIGATTLAGSAKLKDCLPYYVLTPDGDWLENQRHYLSEDWQNITTEALTPEEWLAIVHETLQRYPNHRVVCVDIHA